MSDQPNTLEGIVDSIRDGVAVILVGDDETEHTLPANDLPEQAKEGSRVEVTLDGDEVGDVVVLEAEPSTEQVRHRMDRLKAARPSRLLRTRGEF